MGAGVAPEAVQPLRGAGRPCTTHVEHTFSHTECGTVRQHLGFGAGQGDLAAFFGLQIFALFPGLLQLLRRAVGQCGGGRGGQVHLGITVHGVGVVRRAGHTAGRPGAGLVQRVLAGFTQGTLGQAGVEVHQDELCQQAAQAAKG